MLVDTHERRHMKMNPTLVLSQQRMHVGYSADEVDRSGHFESKETSATTSSLTDWGSEPTSPTSRRRTYTKNHSDNYRNYFRMEQECTGVSVTTVKVFEGRLGGREILYGYRGHFGTMHPPEIQFRCMLDACSWNQSLFRRNLVVVGWSSPCDRRGTGAGDL